MPKNIQYISQLAYLLPALLLFVLHFSRLRHANRSGEYILVVLSGAVSTMPTLILSKYWMGENITPGGVGIITLLMQAFFVVALIEEFCKYLAVRLSVADSVNSLREGMIFGAGASLGFAMVENMIYGANQESAQVAIITGLLRSVTAVPLHAMTGAIIGYSISRSIIERDQSPSRQLQIRMEGLVVAIIWHGVYDFFLFLGNGWEYGIIPVMIGLSVMVSVYFNHAKVQEGQNLN